MVERLVLCGGCSRHMKASETKCPFCGDGAEHARTSTGEPFLRMAAAAVVAAGVAAATGCSSSSGSGNVFYGGAHIVPQDASDDGTSMIDGPFDADSGAVGVFYGLAQNIDATAPETTDGGADATTDSD